MSAEIEFKLTSIAKTDLASLLDGETIEVTKAYITNAQSGEDIPYVSGLSGTVVFNGVVHGEVLFEKDNVIYTKEEWADMPAGTIPDTGILHVEFFDDSETYYSGKTVAITYRKELEERILCLATVESSADELVVKHFSPLSFALDLRFDNADSVSFENINLSFPPATETRRGSVKVASSEDVMSGTGTGVVTSQNLNTRLGDYVTIATTQTITGSKTFTSDVFFGGQNSYVGGDGHYLHSMCINGNVSSEIVQSFGNITFRLYNGSTSIDTMSIAGVSDNTESRIYLNADNTVFPEGKRLSFEKYGGYYLNLYETIHQGVEEGQPVSVPDLKVDMSGLSISEQSRFIISSAMVDVAYFDSEGLTILAGKRISTPTINTTHVVFGKYTYSGQTYDVALYKENNSSNNIASTSNIIPEDNDMYNLGEPVRKWDTIYCNNIGSLSVPVTNIYGSLKGNADTATTAETAKYLTYFPSSGTSTNLIYAASTTSILPIGTSGNIDLGSNSAKFNSIYANFFTGLASLSSESFMLSTINAYLSTPARKEVVGVQATSSVIYNLIPAIKLSENNVTTNLGSSSYKWDRLYCNYIGDDSNKVTTIYADDIKGRIPTNTDSSSSSASYFPKGSIFLAIVFVRDMEGSPVSFHSGYYLDLTTSTLYSNRLVDIYEAISCQSGEADVGSCFKKGRNLTNLRLGFKFLCGLEGTDYMAGEDYFLALVMVY